MGALLFYIPATFKTVKVKKYTALFLQPLFRLAEGWLGEKNINDCPA